MEFRCREFSGSSSSVGRLLDIPRRPRGRTRCRTEPAAQAAQSWAIARKRDARKSRRPSGTLDCRKIRRACRHVAQRRARQARSKRLRPGTSWHHSTPDRTFCFFVAGGSCYPMSQGRDMGHPIPRWVESRDRYEAAWVRAISKVEKRMCWPLISERSSCQSSLGILRKTSTTAGSNCVPEQWRISWRAASKPRALR